MCGISGGVFLFVVVFGILAGVFLKSFTFLPSKADI